MYLSCSLMNSIKHIVVSLITLIIGPLCNGRSQTVCSATCRPRTLSSQFPWNHPPPPFCQDRLLHTIPSKETYFVLTDNNNKKVLLCLLNWRTTDLVCDLSQLATSNHPISPPLCECGGVRLCFIVPRHRHTWMGPDFGRVVAPAHGVL